MTLNQVSTITVSGVMKHAFSRKIHGFGICALLYFVRVKNEKVGPVSFKQGQ